MPAAEVVQCHVEQGQEEDHEGAHLYGAGAAVQDVQHTGVQGPQGGVQEVRMGGGSEIETGVRGEWVGEGQTCFIGSKKRRRKNGPAMGQYKTNPNPNTNL